MYVSMSQLQVAPELSDELVGAFRARAHLVEEAEGFVDLQVWRSDVDRSELIMVSRWESRDHFKAYMKSDAHRVSHDRISTTLKQAIKLQRLNHLHTYEVVAE